MTSPSNTVLALLRELLALRPVTADLQQVNNAVRHLATFLEIGHSVPVAILGLPGKGHHSSDEALKIAGIEPCFAALQSFFATT